MQSNWMEYWKELRTNAPESQDPSQDPSQFRDIRDFRRVPEQPAPQRSIKHEPFATPTPDRAARASSSQRPRYMNTDGYTHNRVRESDADVSLEGSQMRLAHHPPDPPHSHQKPQTLLKKNIRPKLYSEWYPSLKKELAAAQSKVPVPDMPTEGSDSSDEADPDVETDFEGPLNQSNDDAEGTLTNVDSKNSQSDHAKARTSNDPWWSLGVKLMIWLIVFSGLRAVLQHLFDWLLRLELKRLGLYFTE